LYKTLPVFAKFKEKRHFPRRKLAKMAENYDHNIDPKSGGGF
jgi:hypothetical protein